jgi:hypothetical protein
MGLSDIVRGMRNGPRGERRRSGGGGWGSRFLFAALGILAYRMFKDRGERRSDTEPEPPHRRWL